MLEVIEPGLQSTIQDAGRRGLAHLGLRRAGAADPRALAASNLLAGNRAGDAALEMALLGATFAIRRACVIGLAGAEMDAHVPEERRALAPGRAYRLGAGTTLVCGGAVDGARTYLALAGGIAADVVFGSAATDLLARIGGLGGRALQAGDLLAPGRPVDAVEEVPTATWPSGIVASGIARGDGPRIVGVSPGPHTDRDVGVLGALVEATWTVSPRSDRVGLRLDGALSAIDADGRELPGDLVSLPMLPGGVQVPPDGRPIVLLVDAPTVGGYPVPAVVIEADLPVLGQLRPGDELRFEVVDAETARERTVRATEDLAFAARLLAPR
jgi:antagonist of KipI